MKTFASMTLAASVCLMTAALWSTPSQALTMQECSVKYKAAQAGGSKVKWNDFRKTECSADAAATPAAAPAATTTAAKPAPAAKPAAATSTSAAVYPSKLDPKYAKESAGKGRMHTCLDQYNANKASGGNGGLNWIAKGGGYYSECNKRLKV